MAEPSRHVAIGMVRTTIRRRHGSKLGLQIYQSKSSGFRGVSISAIDSGSAAAEAGLRVNDVITMVGVSAPIEMPGSPRHTLFKEQPNSLRAAQWQNNSTNSSIVTV